MGKVGDIIGSNLGSWSNLVPLFSLPPPPGSTPAPNAREMLLRLIYSLGVGRVEDALQPLLLPCTAFLPLLTFTASHALSLQNRLCFMQGVVLRVRGTESSQFCFVVAL